MKTIIKKSSVFLLFIAVMAILTMSFTKKANDKRYGGTASVTVQAIDPNGNHILLNEMHFDNVKPGDKRVIEVNTNCSHDSKTDAQADLQYNIKSETKSYEKQVSSISYNINSCD